VSAEGVSHREILNRLREGAAGAAAERAGRDLNALLASFRSESLDGAAGDVRLAAMDELLGFVADGRLDGAVAENLDLDAFAALGDHLAEALDSAGAAARDRFAPRAWEWLDAVRRPALLGRIAGAGATDRWMDLILRLIDASRFTLARLFEQRVERYGPKTLFRTGAPGRDIRHTWLSVGTQAEGIARGLLALLDEVGRGPVAVLSENRIETALTDVACLTTGIVNVMIPATATDADVAYILEQTGAVVLVAAGEREAQKVERHRASLPALRTVVTFDRVREAQGVRTLSEVVGRGRSLGRDRLERERDAMDPRATATLMYTSGTTGKPKGIRFSQRNLVAKRFARALALPAIGDQDVFLAYLPLYHTFGRYLELWASVFWGAAYVFLPDPSLENLRENFRRVRPTVFISVPKKWMELWEEIGRRVDLEHDPDEKLLAATREVVGDRLRWGISAAGYLAPEIFRFFARQGVQLLSGFGMTEATGGITMTAPGDYREDSLGVPLPGIEVELAEDGEMLIRGPYVMLGYEGEEGSSFDPRGWFHTGDLMERDTEGHYRLVDRKKEIYKNIKGESVAPQRVENLFRDFEEIARVFLVGDHKPYNTLLIVPNPDDPEADLAAMSERERRDHFRSLVVSVNRFLAPYERVVDFALLDRDFSAERDELTPKWTYRRKTVARNFAGVIDTLYRRVQLKSEDLPVEIHVPNWLFQALGLTAGDVRLEDGRLTLAPTGASLTVSGLGRDDEGEIVRIGSCRYRARRRVVDLGTLLASPALWLGNEELVNLAALDPPARVRRARPSRELTMLGRAVPYAPPESELDRLRQSLVDPGPGIEDLDLAARALASPDEEPALLALSVLARALRSEEGLLLDTALLALRGASDLRSPALRRRAFEILFPAEREHQAAATLERFLNGAETLLDERAIARLCNETLSAGKIEVLVRHTRRAVESASEAGDDTAGSLLRFLAAYGAGHPAAFEPLRAALARAQVSAAAASLREEAGRGMDRLTAGFRDWLGPVRPIAVDPDEGNEYRWEDVVTFEDTVPAEDRERISRAVAETGLIREAVYLFSGEALLQLSDIPRGGIWVSLLGARHGRAVYRLTAHTRRQGSFDLALNVNHQAPPEEVTDEVLWLIITGEGNGHGPLVEKFGGHWPEFDLWSEEFIAGETLDRVVNRLAQRRGEDPVDRLRLGWPFFVYSAAGAFLEFWNRTGRRFALAEASAGDIIVPTHDYQTGTRIVSIARRCPAPPVGELLDTLWRYLVPPMVEAHEALAGVAPPREVLTAFLEVVGVREGVALLAGARAGAGPVTGAVDAYLREVDRDGFTPRRLRSAIDRYHRWAALAPDAPPPALAQTVQELFETYRLADLLREYPDTRVRFFRETVFREGPEPVTRGLDALLAVLRDHALEGDDLVDRLSELRMHLEPGLPGEYFLARLTYPHLRPGDEAGFLSTDLGGVRQTDIVVSLEDNQGRPYQVRRPVNPKEVGRLHRLFLGAKLDVQFRPEHHFLVAVNERGSLIGGIFYDLDEENRSAHLEKIVVAERYRKLGVGEGLMHEFFNRLRTAGAETVTTGFFRPSYFYRYGFAVGKRQAGLVKTL
jgi:long-chain acyl-CoA synthetase